MHLGQKLCRFSAILCIILFLSACGSLLTKEDPNTEQSENAMDVLYPNNTQGSDKPLVATKVYKIALFLPIQSKSDPIQKAAFSLLNASRLANSALNNPNMQVSVYATDGTQQTVVPAAQRAVDDKVDLIIGPLLSPSVVSAREITEKAGIPMLAFSNDKNAVDGGFSYSLSYLPEQNIANIADYAISKGHKSFGVFASNTPYGQRVGETFIQQIQESGNKISKAFFFNEQAADFYAKARKFAEVETRQSADKPTSWTSALLPDRAGAIEQILTTLKDYNVDFSKVLILGSGLWNEPNILNIESIEGAVFAAPDQRTMKIFQDRYFQVYNENPSNIAALAYDAIGLASGLIRQYPKNAFNIKHITNPNGFSGVGGIFRFRRNGLSERGLSIIKIKDQQLEQIVPAPDTFIGT